MPIALAFAAGIFFARQLDLTLAAAIAAASAAMAGSLILRPRPAAWYFVLLAFASAGALSAVFERDGVRHDRIRRMIERGDVGSGSLVRLVGTIRSDPEPMTDGCSIEVSAERIELRGEHSSASGAVRLIVSAPDTESRAELDRLRLERGSRIAVPVQLFREEQFQNPGVRSRIELLDQQGIDAAGIIKSPLLIETLEGEPRLLPLVWAGRARGWLIREFERLFTPATAGTMIASTLGDKYFLDRQTSELHRTGGTFHVLVISGLHVTFIGGLLLMTIGRLFRGRWTKFVVVNSLLWVFAIVVGSEVPVVRACLMFSLLHLSRVIDRDSSLLNSLALSALLLLIWRPLDLFAPSFQLTMVSVASIVAMGIPLTAKLHAIGKWTPAAGRPFPPNVPRWLRRTCETLYWDPRAWAIERHRSIWSANLFKAPFVGPRAEGASRRALAYLFDALLISSVIQLWLLPLSVFYFHRFAAASLILNLWVGPLLAVESFAALAAVAVAQVSSGAAAAFVHLTEVINSLLLWLPSALAGFDAASRRVPIYSGRGVWLYPAAVLLASALGAVIYVWDPFRLMPRRRIVSAAAAVLGAAIVGAAFVIVQHPFSAAGGDGRLRIDVLDVGQGDSAFITFPDGGTMLVDGGGSISFQGEADENAFEPDRPRIGEFVVSEFVWEQGRSSIDHVVATHADSDHIDGLVDVIRNFDVGELIIARRPADDPELGKLLHAAQLRNIPVTFTWAGRAISIAGVSVETLWPDSDTNGASDNDRSIVMRLVYGDRTFLLTGDIERSAEEALLLSPVLLKADLIKVPHHGSRSSSTPAFVNAVGPAFAMISVGRRSRFGHPHPEVVRRWRQVGAEVRTTGELGSITVTSDGSDLCVTSYVNRSTLCR